MQQATYHMEHTKEGFILQEQTKVWSPSQVGL